MKKFLKPLCIMLISIMTICLLAGCGGKSADSEGGGESDGAPAATVDISTIKTVGDAFAIEGKDEYSEQRSTYNGKYVYAFTVNGTAYRVIADVPSDIEEKIFALEFDDDHDKNEEALVADLPVALAEDLTEYILPQEELDALVGKTGQELLDAGWRAGSFYNTETLEVWLEYGPYAYDMHFDGKVAPEDADSFNFPDDLADMKVVDATYEGLGDATVID